MLKLTVWQRVDNLGTLRKPEHFVWLLENDGFGAFLDVRETREVEALNIMNIPNIICTLE